ncbi:hypothetical protein [Tardiphaga robiniae]|uniref:Uncharacterized protein n=1 Tax=Tardiphaga robiniae TaxID=943830 RepID=A0A7G6TSQ3_9BRAD|nr:hypothetical protein [Tardiphaga robiniae]QND69785.1 hypothetical protein HB776_04475 [Tardiphaga robiniae]
MLSPGMMTGHGADAMQHAQPPMTKYELFLQQAQEQMLAFERRESEFRKREREERAAQLHLPISRDELH